MGSYYQPAKYLTGGASYYQPKNYLSGGMKINTSNHKNGTKLSKAKVHSIQKRIEDFDFDKSKEEQYDEIKSILSMVDEEDFDNEFHKKEIGTLKHIVKKVSNNKKGSKPSEFLNVLERVLNSIEPKEGGKRKNSGTRKQKQNGGFYPSIMGGVMSAGKILMVASLRQGYRMLTSSDRSKKRKNNTKKVRSFSSEGSRK